MILLLLACVPSFEDAPTKAAEAYCDYADDCRLLQEGEVEDCVEGAIDTFETLWPEEQCAEGFDRKAWGDCMDTIQSWECDSSSIGMDVVGDACGSSIVCL